MAGTAHGVVMSTVEAKARLLDLSRPPRDAARPRRGPRTDVLLAVGASLTAGFVAGTAIRRGGRRGGRAALGDSLVRVAALAAPLLLERLQSQFVAARADRATRDANDRAVP